jgi:hypothetical protein
MLERIRLVIGKACGRGCYHNKAPTPRAAPNSGNTSGEGITIRNAMLDICKGLSLHPKRTVGPYEMCKVPSQ